MPPRTVPDRALAATPRHPPPLPPTWRCLRRTITRMSRLCPGKEVSAASDDFRLRLLIWATLPPESCGTAALPSQGLRPDSADFLAITALRGDHIQARTSRFLKRFARRVA